MISSHTETGMAELQSGAAAFHVNCGTSVNLARSFSLISLCVRRRRPGCQSAEVGRRQDESARVHPAVPAVRAGEVPSSRICRPANGATVRQETGRVGNRRAQPRYRA